MDDILSDRMLKTSEVARIFDVKVYTVRQWIRDGRMSAVETATGRYRVKESEVKRFANERYGAS